MSGVSVIKVEGKYFTVFSVTYRQSSAPAPLPLPPPTTLVGALSASLARIRHEPETAQRRNELASRAIELLDTVKYAAFGVREGTAIPFQDLSRFLMASYQHRSYLHFGALAFGRVSAPIRFSILYFVNSKEYADLTKAAWGILAIGNKESLVSVDDVRVLPLRSTKLDEGETIYYVPSDIVSREISSCKRIHMWPLVPEAYMAKGAKMEEWLAPLSSLGPIGGKMRIRRNNKGIFTEIGDELVLVPKQVLGDNG